MVVSDGQIIGTWKRVILANSIEVEFEFFNRLNKLQGKALANAIHWLEEFTSMKVNDVSKKASR